MTDDMIIIYFTLGCLLIANSAFLWMRRYMAKQIEDLQAELVEMDANLIKLDKKLAQTATVIKILQANLDRISEEAWPK